jgi:4-carboxymuconolactone decarboxylase
MKSAAADPSAFVPKGLEEFMPTLPPEMLEAFLGKGASPEGLDAKTRLLLTLGGMVASGAPQDTPVKLTVRHAQVAGATKQEIFETIAQMSVFGGAPAMTTAMTAATAELEKDEGQDT